MTGFALGFVMARYREIFFAMLSMALSMILYGILVRSAALGSTDGFNLSAPTFLGIAADGANRPSLHLLPGGNRHDRHGSGAATASSGRRPA